MQSTRNIPAAVALALGTMTCASVALAEQERTGSRQVGQLEEIVVTGTKRAVSQQDTPMAVSTLTAAQIDNTRLRDIRAIGELAPNVTLTNQPGFNALAGGIRGTGTVSILATQDSAVGVLVDEFALAHVQSQFVEMFDIEQIEVYRGPQGTLFGKNTTGGVISVTTRRPVMNEYSGDVELEFGEYKGGAEHRMARIAINAPLIEDRLAFRFAGIYDYSDGFYRNDKDTANFPDLIPLYALFGLPAANPPLPPELDTRNRGTGERLGGRDVFAGKAKLLWQPTDRYEAYFVLELLRDRSDSPPGVNETPPGEGFLLEALGFPGIRAEGGTANPFSTGVTNQRFGINIADGHQVDATGYYLTQQLEFDRFSLRSITGYRDQEETLPSTYTGEAFATLFDAGRNMERDQFQQELRLVSDFEDQPYDFVLGAVYFRDDLDFRALTSVGLQALLPSLHPETGTFLDPRGFVNLDTAFINDPFFQVTGQTRDAWAAYLDGTWDINERLSFSAGLRFTSDRKKFLRWIDGGGVCGPFTRARDAIAIDPDLPIDIENNINCRDLRSDAISRAGLTGAEYDQRTLPLGPEQFGVVVETSDRWSRLTWRGAVNFAVTPEIMTYASVATGFQSGGYTETCSSIATCIPYQPETNRNHEVGLKADLFDDRLRINTAVFLTDYRNLQRNQVVPFVNAVGNETQETITLNTGESRATGVELEVVWAPIGNLRVDLSASYLRHKYRTFTLDDPATGPQDLSDLAIPFSPRWQLGVGATIDQPLARFGTLAWNIGAHYQSQAETSVFNSSFTQMESRTLVNASVTLFEPADRFWVSLYGRNLLDETHRLAGNSVAGLWNFTQYGAPRQWGIQLGASF